MPRAARLDSQGTLRLVSKIRSEISDILIQEHALTVSESVRLLGVLLQR
jgi:hypothetical protein